MADPNWNRGFYYDEGRLPPHTGMKLARQIATITYRSGPEWEQRFGRERRRGSSDAEDELAPALCPDFLIETYLDHQGEQFCLKYDANSLIYVSKAMDLFDMSQDSLASLEKRREKNRLARQKEDDDQTAAPTSSEPDDSSLTASAAASTSTGGAGKRRRQHIQTLSSPSAHTYLDSLAEGLRSLSDHPTLIIGAQSDILFPIDQQRELAECLRRNGNTEVRYYEIDAPHGHDSFLCVFSLFFFPLFSQI